MQFSELKEKVKGVGFVDLRKETDNYFEGVILKKETEQLCRTLKKFLGSPLWPRRWRLRQKLSLRVKEAIKDFGGIMDGQTLYFYNRGHNIVFAMLWPWRDGVHITIKIIQKEQ